jgi:hypothetical protein
MKKHFAIICLFFLSLGKVFAQEQAAPAAATAPQITFINQDTVYDFGGIPIGTVIENQFEIRNTGNVPLVITGMTCESANLKCKWPAKSIKPGKKGLITLSYSAHGDEGSFKDDVYITSNATHSPYPFIHITGAIIPAGGSYIPSSTPSKGRGGRGSRGGS